MISTVAQQPQGTGEPGWLRLIIWLAAISPWAFASVRVLRQSPESCRAGVTVAPNAQSGDM